MVYCSIWSGVPVQVITLVNFVFAACDPSIEARLSVKKKDYNIFSNIIG